MNFDAKELFDQTAQTARDHARRGLPDYVVAMVDAETKADHEQAKARGERLHRLADWITAEAFMLRHPPLQRDVYNAALKVLADSLYGNVAIDMPARRT